MRIIIAGNGKCGMSLTKQLSKEGHDVIVIDTKENVLNSAIERYDVQTILGNCLSMNTLSDSGVEHATIIIAVTGSDETNLLCTLIAKKMNPNIHTIPRIRTPEYLNQLYEFKDLFGVSLAVNPDLYAAKEIFSLLEYPAFLKRETFSKGRVEIVELRIEKGSILENVSIQKLTAVVGCKVLICAIFRNSSTFIPKGTDILLEGDHIYVTAPAAILVRFMRHLGIVSKPIKHVMLIGGSRMGYYLAKELCDSGVETKIIENNPSRVNFLAENLPEAIIINGDGSSQEILDGEGLSEMDALVTLTGMDEMNIIISLFGGSRNVKKIITKINRMDAPELLENIGLGSIINSTQLSENVIVQYVRALENQTGAAVSVHKIANGEAEAVEFVVDTSTKYLNTPLREIKLNTNILVACITHKGNTFIPDGSSILQDGDTVVIVVTGENPVTQLNEIFA